MGRDKDQLQPRVLRKGAAPPCVSMKFQCRGCFGWDNFMRAARRDPRWRKVPLHCQCTGLTVTWEKSAK